MARIRSVHPGQWRDEDFVECGFAARLLAIALRNEADDQGMFEWKPKQLKMNCFPADSVDIDALLSELVRANIIKTFEIDGRRYGAIRNFRAYQRPKTPNSVHPMTDEIREYVALDGRKSGKDKPSSQVISEICDDDDDFISEPVPKSGQQRKDGGDKMKGEGDKPSLRSGDAGARDLLGDPPKKKAKAFPEKPDWVPQEPWDAFLEFRRRKGPFTADAAILTIRKLEELRDRGHEPGDVLNQSVQRGWTGVFEIKPENHNGANGHGTSNLIEGTRRAIDRAREEENAGSDHA